MPKAVLLVNGKEYAGWQSVRVTRSLEQVAGSFSLGVTDIWDAWSQSSGMGSIKEGDFCQVQFGGETIINGTVDDRSVSYDKENHSISITGRDATGDLVDCSVVPTQIKGQTLLQIAQQVCKPFGIPALSNVDIGAVFGNRTFEPGQLCFELLSSLAAHRGLLLVSDTLGNLVITKPSQNRSAGALVFGENILACNGTASMRDRYRDYAVRHDTPQSDGLSGEAATQIKATAHDRGVLRYRPLTIQADDATDLQKKVLFERNVRAAKAKPLTYTVAGWLADDFTLWKENTVVSITDPHQQPPLDKTDMLISTVSFIRDESGTRTEISVVAQGAFDVLAAPEKDVTAWP